MCDPANNVRQRNLVNFSMSAAHEEAERRAMEGELGELERAWREAEEIAAISDDLLLPTGVQQKIERLHDASPETRATNG